MLSAARQQGALARRLARIDPRQDPRLGGGAALHTAGIDRGLSLAAARPPRPYLFANPHRDLAGERAEVARHASIFHTTDVRSFNSTELHVWRAGIWRNEWHYGRRGWWWEAGDGFYPYGYPVWPYPVAVTVPVVYAAPVVDGPDLSAQEGVAPPPLPDASADAAPDATPSDANPGLVAAAQPTAGQDSPINGDASQGAGAQPGAAGAQPPLASPAAVPADSQGQTATAAPRSLPDIPPLPPAPVGWFRCDAPSGYFPGVADCTASWTLVENAPLPGEQ